jgi:hypothetical protein
VVTWSCSGEVYLLIVSSSGGGREEEDLPPLSSANTSRWGEGSHVCAMGAYAGVTRTCHTVTS